MVLDTSAFVAGYDPFAVGEEQVTAPKVEEEIQADNLTSLRFLTAVESGKVKVMQPKEEFLAKAKAAAASVGDAHKLSEADMQLLALALELEAAGKDPQIVTDDYSIQNVAKESGLGFVSLATFGIRRVLKWIRYCPACHKVYPADYRGSTCGVCGTPLKRKPQREKKQTLSRL